MGVIEDNIKKIKSLIDYKRGDWVETCSFLPGICVNITCRYDRQQQYIDESVDVYMPHKNSIGCCSIDHCGVHKISEDYAKKLFQIGEDKLSELWNVFITSTDYNNWEDYINNFTDFQPFEGWEDNYNRGVKYIKKKYVGRR